MAHAYISRRTAIGLLLKGGRLDRCTIIKGVVIEGDGCKPRSREKQGIFGTQLRYLAESATRDQLKAICEVALNYTRGNLVSTISFDRNTRFLKALANAETPLSLKKRLISESTIYRNIVKRLLSSVSDQL